MKWFVWLLQEPAQPVFCKGYFPRTFAYKADAKDLVKEIEKTGGRAAVFNAGGHVRILQSLETQETIAAVAEEYAKLRRN